MTNPATEVTGFRGQPNLRLGLLGSLSSFRLGPYRTFEPGSRAINADAVTISEATAIAEWRVLGTRGEARGELAARLPSPSGQVHRWNHAR